MTGLEKIVSQILDDAGKEASEITAKAQKEAQAILAESNEACRRLEEENRKKLDEKRQVYMERIQSSAELKKRQAVLLAKQQVIAEMLEKAYQSLLEKEDGEYFELIKKMLDKFTLAKSGEIYFSKRDLSRMPSGFEADIKKAAEKKGGELTLSHESKDIDGGFILVYGGVEENCSFKALLSARKDELSDKVHSLLFA